MHSEMIWEILKWPPLRSAPKPPKPPKRPLLVYTEACTYEAHSLHLGLYILLLVYEDGLAGFACKEWSVALTIEAPRGVIASFLRNVGSFSKATV